MQLFLVTCRTLSRMRDADEQNSHKRSTDHILATRVDPFTTILALSGQDLTKFLQHLGDHGTHGKIPNKIIL